MEIRVLARDPGKEACNLFVGAKAAQFAADPLQLRIGKAGMKRAVANGMDRPLLPPAAALWHRVMPLHPPAQRASAKPAGFSASFHFENLAGFRTPANRR